VSDALPQPPGPPIRKRGVVAVVLDGERFLVIRRSQHVRAPGMFCFPGGAIEPGVTEVQAVAREMLEELSVVARPARRLWESVTPWHVHLAWWLVEIAPGAAIVPQPAEVESFHWLTAAEMRRMSDVLSSNLEFFAIWESKLKSGLFGDATGQPK
jgi:8-oxo-dGTP pyrophosphatase MutT (NUDIX family)